MLETNQTIIKHKPGLLNLAEELGDAPQSLRETYQHSRVA